MCEHKFNIKKEKIQTKVDFLGGRKKIKIIELVCEKCGDVGFREMPAGDEEK